MDPPEKKRKLDDEQSKWSSSFSATLLATPCLVSGFDPGIKITFADAADINACLALPSLASVGPANGVPQLIRGATAAQSKTFFINWVDDLVASIGTDSCKVYTASGVRDWGNFANLSDRQFMAVLAKFSGLRQWTADIMNNNGSCGAFFIIIGGGVGRVSQQGMFIGPFQT